MGFNEPIFALFLCLILCIYTICLRSHPSLALILLLLASLAFYAYRIPWHLSCLILVSAVAFGGGSWLTVLSGRRRNLAVMAILLLLFAPLLVFKYFEFIVSSLPMAIPWLPSEEVLGISLVLPLGI